VDLIASCLLMVGRAAAYQEQWDEAAALYQRAMDAMRAVYSESHPRFASALSRNRPSQTNDASPYTSVLTRGRCVATHTIPRRIRRVVLAHSLHLCSGAVISERLGGPRNRLGTGKPPKSR